MLNSLTVFFKGESEVIRIENRNNGNVITISDSLSYFHPIAFKL